MADWGSGAKGAASGAAMGTAIMPGWGTAIGAGIGGLYGLFGGDGDERKAPQIADNPYLGHYRQLISQLQQTASGQGPSLAGNAYKAAHQQGLNDVRSMSQGGSAGAMRQGQQQLGQMNQGLAAGYSNARLQEQLAAQQQLASTLAGASNAWFQPQQANLDAQMKTQTEQQKMLSFLSQLTQSYATLRQKDPNKAGKTA